MKALMISGVTFSYNAAAGKAVENPVEYALENFNLELEGGQIYALLGPNGAGKTTLMRIITGQLRGYKGSVAIYGDNKVCDMAYLKNIGYAPQPVSLFTTLTAAENLRFFGIMAGIKGKKLQERSVAVLTQTGLIPCMHRQVSTYSGGMLRRLNLAVALLHEPKLLLLDEPTTGVDPQSRHHIYETLISLNATGMTILLCTHLMDEAQRLCSRVTMMDRGKAVFTGDMAGIDNLEKFFLEKTGRGLRDE